MSFKDPRQSLQDILDAVARIEEFTAGMDFESFRSDAKTNCVSLKQECLSLAHWFRRIASTGGQPWITLRVEARVKLVNSVLKDWGCDCIFFFNYNRINMGLSNPIVAEHMNALFGPERAEELRGQLESLNPYERELRIVEELCKALGSSSGRYVLPFRFRSASGSRTSHHLIFVSKHFRGYEIMKDIMAKESSTHDQGVPSLEYSPADERFPLLFELTRPLDELAEILLRVFAGKRMKMHDIYMRHNIGTPFIARNYKDALLKLETAGRIVCEPPAAKRRKGTMGSGVIVQFPLYRDSHVT